MALSRLICHDFARIVLLRTLRGVNSYSSSAKLDSLELVELPSRIVGLIRISSARLDLPFYLYNYGISPHWLIIKWFDTIHTVLVQASVYVLRD